MSLSVLDKYWHMGNISDKTWNEKVLSESRFMFSVYLDKVKKEARALKNTLEDAKIYVRLSLFLMPLIVSTSLVG